MDNYIPTVYKKTIFDIDYEKLYNNSVRHLLFDLDNTLTMAHSRELTEETIKLISMLKEKFTVDLVSNSRKKRVEVIAKLLDIEYISFARKPATWSFKAIQEKYNCNKEALLIIGDQLMTDIIGGNRYGIKTALIDPVGMDAVVTYFNRWRENRKLKKLAETGKLERGKYYE